MSRTGGSRIMSCDCGGSCCNSTTPIIESYDTVSEALSRAREMGSSRVHTHKQGEETYFSPGKDYEDYQQLAGYGDGVSCPPGEELKDGKCVPIAVTLEIEINEILATISAETGQTIISMRGVAFHEGFNKNNWQISSGLAEMVADSMVGSDVTLNHPSIENGMFTRNMTGDIDEAVVGIVQDAFVVYEGTGWEVNFSADIMREELFSSLESGLWLREGYGVSIGGTGIPDTAEETENGKMLITFSTNFMFDHLAIVHSPAYDRARIESVERKEVELSATVKYDYGSDLEYPQGAITMSDEITEIKNDNSAEMEALRADKILLEAQVAEYENAKKAKSEEERMLLVNEATSLGMKGHDDLSTDTLTGLIASWNEAHPQIEEEVVEMKPIGASVEDDEPVAPATSIETKEEVVANYFNKERIETPKAVYAKAYNTWVSAWNKTLTPAESQFRAKSFEDIRGE